MSTLEHPVTEDAVEEVVEKRDQLREDALALLGVTGNDEDKPPPLRRVLKSHGLTLYPLAALCTLSLVDLVFSNAFTVLIPDIARSLGLSKGAIAAVVAAGRLAGAASPLLVAALAQKPRRAMLAVGGGIAWAVVSLGSGYVVLVWGLLLVLVLDGFTTGGTQGLHQPLLFDSYPPEARVRAVSYYQACWPAGHVIAPLSVALLASLGLTWRGTFLVFGLATVVVVLFTTRLRDPGFGKWDTERLRHAVDEAEGGDVRVGDTELGFFEIVRRLFLIPTVKRLLVGFAVFGILLVPYITFMQFFLEDRWGLDSRGRGLVVAVQAAASVITLALFGSYGERMFRRDPAAVVRLAAATLGLGVVSIGLAALAPWFGLMVGLFALSGAFIGLIGPALGIVLLSVIPARMRPHASALIGIFSFGVGGTIGLIFLSGIDRRFGITGSIVSLVVPGVLGSILLFTVGRLVRPDLNRMVDEILEDEEIKQLRASGRELPLLACRGIDFSYGQLQVLFDVDFTVDEGEMVALLGVNGAGKSTLLRVVSGLGLPSRGSVRLRGQEITFLDPDRRVGLGITQIPGGKAVFGPMSVADNMRAYGYTIGRRRGAVEEAMEVAFATFPRLAERRNQPASTLSGGEQQMLALSKALMLRPPLLLIDELSLGLAPVIVGQLLEIVKRINAQGTAIVLVEQSVNIALNLVNHAYFMEKGEMRFDGPAKDLLSRDDLLRAVFLKGAQAGAGR